MPLKKERIKIAAAEKFEVACKFTACNTARLKCSNQHDQPLPNPLVSIFPLGGSAHRERRNKTRKKLECIRILMIQEENVIEQKDMVFIKKHE